MNDAKHTPRPWKIAEESILANLDGWRRDFIVVHSTVYNHGQTALVPNGAGELGEANARLIAAAPDLLEACEATLPWIGKMIADGAHMNSVAPNACVGAMQRLEAAIRKAEGR